MGSAARGARYELITSEPQLFAVELAREPVPAPAEADDVRVRFDLRYGRKHERHLGVELRARVEAGDWARVTLAYRVGFVFRGVIGEDELATSMRLLATQVAPQALYPFIRETVLSLTQKSGGPPITLPLVDWSVELGAFTFELPPPGAPAPEDVLRPLESAGAER
jgi:preprotein translocase subunit SecB